MYYHSLKIFVLLPTISFRKVFEMGIVNTDFQSAPSNKHGREKENVVGMIFLTQYYRYNNTL